MESIGIRSHLMCIAHIIDDGLNTRYTRNIVIDYFNEANIEAKMRHMSTNVIQSLPLSDYFNLLIQKSSMRYNGKYI